MMNLTTCDFPEYTALSNLRITNKPDTEFLNSNYPILYTDGSKMPTGVGAAFTVYEKGNFIFDYKISMNKFSSVYRAELIAIQYAISWFLDTSYGKVIIYTDNKSSTMALQRNFPANQIRNIYRKPFQHPERKVTIG